MSLPSQHPAAAEVSPVWSGKIFNGDWIDGQGGAMDVVAPATGQVIGTVGAATPTDLDAAVASAQAAQREWAALPYDQRAKVFRTAAALLEAHPDRLAGWLVPEAGSGAGKAGFEVFLVVSELQQCAALTAEPYGELLRSF